MNCYKNMSAGHIENIRKLAQKTGRQIKLMEVCGTHTMSAFRSGLRSLLPSNVSLLSGPGCPVCVTTVDYIDRAIAIAQQPNTLIVSFGDMVRVPGTVSSLETARARGAQVRVVYSPVDALNQAERHPDKHVVFLGVGFETTAPAIAWTIKEAKGKKLNNYSVLCGHKLIPPAMAALLQSDEVKIDGFMCPGHVSVIIGARAYEFICRDYHIPCVVAGFEAADMAITIELLLQQILDNRAEVAIQYSRSVKETGNAEAQAIMNEVFEECDDKWRGLGIIPRSGLRIRKQFAEHDASTLFGNLHVPVPVEYHGCICGDILKGTRLPTDCALFRTRCTPEMPLGPCMVSGEGTCAAYYKYAVTAQKSRVRSQPARPPSSGAGGESE